MTENVPSSLSLKAGGENKQTSVEEAPGRSDCFSAAAFWRWVRKKVLSVCVWGSTGYHTHTHTCIVHLPTLKRQSQWHTEHWAYVLSPVTLLQTTHTHTHSHTQHVGMLLSALHTSLLWHTHRLQQLRAPDLQFIAYYHDLHLNANS